MSEFGFDIETQHFVGYPDGDRPSDYEIQSRINNLQQENQHFKQILEEMGLDPNEILYLKQENQQLKEENKKLKQWDCNKDTRNSRQRVANAKQIKKINLYKSGIDEIMQYCLDEQIPDDNINYNEFVEVQNMAYEDIYNKIKEIITKVNIKEDSDE